MRLLATLAMLWLTACASQTSPPEDCASLECMKARQRHALVVECVDHLVMYESYDIQTREWVDGRYHYPLTSAASYWAWVRMGGIGPSPQRYCRAWADALTK